MHIDRNVESQRVKKLSLSVIFLLLLSYILFHAFYGQRGIVSYFKLTNELELKLAELERLQSKHLQLEHQVKLLRSESLDLDMLDEVARKTLGLAKPTELIITTKE